MRIGVLSDTHMRSFEELPQKLVSALSDVDLIVHAGDLTVLGVLEGLKWLSDVIAVQGNMDSAEVKDILPENDLIEIEGKKIGVTHGSGGSLGMESRVRGMFGEVDAIIYGHTHEPKNKLIDGILFFNPGQARRTFGILTVEADIEGEIIKL